MTLPPRSLAPATAPEVRRQLGWWLVLLASAVLPYAPGFGFGFVNLDDPAAIIDLPLIRTLSTTGWKALPGFFTPDIYRLLPEYMPLKNLSYAIDFAFFGLAAPAFRIQQQLWFVGSIALTYVWLRQLLTRLATLGRLGLSAEQVPLLAFATTALYALHPSHVESVTWLSGRKDVLCGAFMAAALLAGLQTALAREAPEQARRRWLWPLATLVCTLLALLSKPTAIALLPLLVAQELWLAPSGFSLRALLARLPLMAAVLVLTLGYALMYSQLTQLHASDDPSDAFGGPAWLRIGQQLTSYLGIAFSPSELVPVMPPELIGTHVASVAGAGAALMLVLCTLGLVLGARKRHVLGFCLTLFVLALLPSLLRPVWRQYVAGRYLYLGVLGPILALTWLLLLAGEQSPRLARLTRVTLLGVGGLWALLAASYTTAWRDSDTLWSYCASIYPHYPQYYDLGARAALQRRDLPRALHFLETCVHENPDAVLCKAPLGGLLLMSDPARGEQLLQDSLAQDDRGTAHLRLAQYWTSQGRANEAYPFYSHWLSGRRVSPDEIDALATIALAAGDTAGALRYLPQVARAAAVEAPASPAPVALITSVATRAGDDALAQRARAAAQHCARADCFANAMGW